MIDVSAKLEAIAKLPAGELAGWWNALGKYREPFEGERTALLERAKKLGVDPATGERR